MKEIDTESPVIWPAWCYSRNLEVSEYLNKSLSKTTKFEESVDLMSTATDQQQRKDENHCVINKSSTQNNNKSIDDIIFQKLPLKRKVIKVQSVDECSQQQQQQQQQIEQNNSNNIRKKRRKRSNIAANTVETKMLSEHSLLNSLANLNKLETPKKLEGSQLTQSDETAAAAAAVAATSQQAAAAATLLFLDQAKNEAAARLDSLKDAIMESAANALGNKNNNNNNNNMNVRNNNNHLLLSQVRNQNQLVASNEIDNATTDVKRERLSPGTNGELLTNYSRCRSATPSPQQSLHISSPQPPIIPVHNLSTNLLNSLQATSNCQGNQSTATTQNVPNATNYSDFMRSLAAKYNNTNPNDSNTPRRHTFFDNANLPSSSKMTSLNTTQKPAISMLPTGVSERETSSVPASVNSLISPVDLASAAFKSTNVQNQMVAAAAAASVSPFMTSLLSTLPFPQGILAPWIDMSNTQALLILSRAAKEAKLEKTMRSMQSPKRSHSSASSSPRPNSNLSTALHQAAQLISPTLLYSAQAQKTQNLRSQQNSPAETQITDPEAGGTSSRMSTNLAVPLDLSSQPPVNKRFKAESTSSRSSVEELTNIVTSGLKQTSIATTITTTTKEVSPTPRASQKVSAAPPTRQNLLKNIAYRQQCQSQSEEVVAWTVDDVCTFVASIDICAEYVENFRNQQIDGSGLPLLTEDHLVNWLGMKLGPALKLRSILAKKLGGPCPCVACVAQSQQILALNQRQQEQQQQQQQQLKLISSRENTPTEITVVTTEQQQQQQVKKESKEEVEKSTTALVQEQEEQCCGGSSNNNNNNNKNSNNDNKNMHNQSKSGGNKGSNNSNNSCSEAIFLTCAKNNNNNNANSEVNIDSKQNNNTNNNNNNNTNNNKNLPSSTCNSNIVNNLSSYCNDALKNNKKNNNNNNDIDTKTLKQHYL